MKLPKGISNIWNEGDDGWWATCESGYYNSDDDSTQFHAETKKALLSDIKYYLKKE
jgi:hypothetical protein